MSENSQVRMQFPLWETAKRLCIYLKSKLFLQHSSNRACDTGLPCWFRWWRNWQQCEEAGLHLGAGWVHSPQSTAPSTPCLHEFSTEPFPLGLGMVFPLPNRDGQYQSIDFLVHEFKAFFFFACSSLLNRNFCSASKFLQSCSTSVSLFQCSSGKRE